MPITPVTHALANASPATNPEILLGPKSVDIISSVFTVGTEPCYIQAFGLGGGENVRVEMVSGNHAANWRPLGKTVMVTPNNPMLRIDWPGKYRLTFSGVSLASILVQMYFGTTSHETIYGVSTINGGGTDFTAVVGDTPITVVGSGTPADPYHVGIDNLNFLHGGINLGPNAGDGSTSSFNINIGLNAADTTAASSSIIIGNDAGAEASSGSDNIMMGSTAAHGVSGDNNIFIGRECATDFAGSDNIVIGYSAATGGSGSSNVLIGSTVSDTISASESVCIGHTAGLNLGGTDAVCIGHGAGNSVTGSGIIAIGAVSGSGSSGENNVCIGSNAGTALPGDTCVAVGYRAAFNSTLPDDSIAIGRQAGTLASGKGIYIGATAGTSNSFANVIVIDQAGSSLLPTAANYCMLGDATITHTVTAGTVIAAGAVAPSDLRLKVNIEDLDGACARVNSLRPVQFEWNAEKLNSAGIPHAKTDLNKRHAGLIAQEVEDIIPEAIEYVAGKDGDSYKFIHYDRLVPYLIQYVQHLEERLSLLEIK